MEGYIDKTVDILCPHCNQHYNFTYFVKDTKDLNDLINRYQEELLTLQTSWFTQDMNTTIEIATKIKMVRNFINNLEMLRYSNEEEND